MFSKTKRFEDSVTCAPAPGTYTLPEMKSKGQPCFNKSKRFQEEKDTSLLNPIKTPSKPNASLSQAKQSITKKVASCSKILEETPASLRNDFCRRSLEADMELEGRKTNALLEKMKSLELQLQSLKTYSSEIEESNSKLHDLIDSIRKEKTDAVNKLIEFEEDFKVSEDNFERRLSAIEINLKKEHQELLDDLTAQHKVECGGLQERLMLSQNLNCDFREQLESVEHTMNKNLKEITIKYEALENTLAYTQKNYTQKLDRSHSLLEKTKEAHTSCQSDLSTMQHVYNVLKDDYQQTQNQLDVNEISYKQSQDEVEMLRKDMEDLKANNEEEINSVKKSLEELSKELSIEQDKYIAHIKDKDEEIQSVRSLLSSKEAEYAKMMSSFQSNISALQSNVKQKDISLEALNREIKMHAENSRSTRDAFEQEKKSLKNSLHLLQCESEKLESLCSEKERESEETKNVHEKVVRQLMETQIKLSESEGKYKSAVAQHDASHLQDEVQRWKDKFNELERTVGPFMNQLNQFQREKELLMNENVASQKEIGSLAEKYATLLGHQNHRQKIHHIRKLKEENLNLKSEVTRLRTNLDKHKRTLLESRPSKISKFISVGKENLKGPLSQANS